MVPKDVERCYTLLELGKDNSIPTKKHKLKYICISVLDGIVKVGPTENCVPAA